VKLLLLRHGRTAWNDAGRYQGHADPDLDDIGRAQAAAVGPVVRAMRPDLVVSSDLRRCQQTALALDLPYSTDERLREIDIGYWSGLTQAEASRAYPEEEAAWLRGQDIRRGGGETYEEVGRRAARVFDDILRSGQATDGALIVFVLHGGTARALAGSVLGLAPSLWWHLGPLGNCRWSTVRRVANDAYRLSEHNAGPLSVPALAAEVAATATAGGRPTGAGADDAADEGAVDDQLGGGRSAAGLPEQDPPFGPGPRPVHSRSVT
jgi:broad specificity phosphatase PhoE